ncbi:MAG: SDR family oxidoreductase [Azospirillaceae bacterium]
MSGEPVLVTGAGGAIGRAIVAALLAADRTVIATSPATEADRLADLPARFIPAQLPEETEALIGSLPDALGGIVHAAGVAATHAAEDFDADRFDRLFAINVRVPVELTARLAGRCGSGASIVFVGSVGGTRASPFHLTYGASKAALHNAMKSFAKALAGRGIRVNAVCPGLVDTALSDASNADLARITGKPPDTVRQGRIDAIPMGRAGLPEDVAGAVVYLMSDAASFVTGAELMLTGGGDL